MIKKKRFVFFGGWDFDTNISLAKFWWFLEKIAAVDFNLSSYIPITKLQKLLLNYKIIIKHW